MRTASVGASPSADETRRVGVLSPHNSKETKAILNAIRALGHEPVWIRDENVTSWIEDGSVRVSPRVDVLINRMLVTKSDTEFEDLQLGALYAETTPVLNSPQAVANTLHKFRSGAALAEADLPVPDAYYGRSPRTFDRWTDHFPEHAAHKPTVGTNGRDMSVVSPADAVGPKIASEHSFVQEFLGNVHDQSSDFRVYVVDGNIIGAMERHAPEGEWRTNVALGGDVHGVTDELGQEPCRLARKATRVLDLDFAGVDLMAVDSEWFILEVNATAGFKGLFGATGVSAAPHIARMAIEKGGGVVEKSVIRDVESTLDDSIPECKPPVHESTNDEDILGYTTRIRVNGRDGTEQTLAKSDTGAKRTCIDTELAGRIGAGPLVGTTTVRSGSGTTETRPLVDVELSVNGRWRTITASISDRSEMRYPVLLGRDVLESYTLDVSRRIEE